MKTTPIKPANHHVPMVAIVIALLIGVAASIALNNIDTSIHRTYLTQNYKMMSFKGWS